MPVSPQILQELDAAVKLSFQSLRDSYFHKLILCTIAVVIGVVAEEAEYFLSWRSVRRLIPLSILLPKHRFDSWALITSKIGWGLIVIGVAGEGIYEAQVSRADGWLQEFSNTLLTSAQRQAADAMDEAVRANAETTKLTSENLKLRAAMADRELTLDQQRNIGKRLERFAGRTVVIRSYPGDGEAKRLGLEIKNALHLASIDPWDSTEHWLNDAPLTFGIRVECAEDEGKPQRDFANAIIGALRGHGNLSVLPLSEFGCGLSITEIHVGIRPPVLAK